VLKLYSFSFLFDNTDMNMIINIKLILKFKTEFILNEYEYLVFVMHLNECFHVFSDSSFCEN
jgi:hypothetical protein